MSELGSSLSFFGRLYIIKLFHRHLKMPYEHVLNSNFEKVQIQDLHIFKPQSFWFPLFLKDPLQTAFSSSSWIYLPIFDTLQTP